MGYASDTLVRIGDTGTDTAVGLSEDRGTGFYRVPTLVGVAARAPYYHDASAPSLDTILRRTGPGHPFAPDLREDERAAILRVLNAL